MKDFIIKNKKTFIQLILIGALLLLPFLGFYQCPFRLLFGFPCPCCGMTRAVRSAVFLNLPESFLFHPVWPIAVIFLLSQIFYLLNILKNKLIWTTILPIITAASILICYIYRIINGFPF